VPSVVDRDGRDPEEKWGNILEHLISDRFEKVVRGLISGQLVRSDDAKVQISFKKVTDTRLNIQIREADPDRQKAVLNLVVEAIDPTDLDHPDPRGLASPVPDRWMVIRSDTTQDWELYNCRIHSLKPSNP
jgi:hypothetical protein